jgi:threonine/homoserine/homoserine lactone efflux protein
VTLTATQLGLYATALFVLFLTPGPVWLATAARALAHGWVAAVPLVLGVALGDALWSVTAALGLAWIVGSYGWVMDVLKWVAVAVFALMGVLLIRHADKTIQRIRRGFHQGSQGVGGCPQAAGHVYRRHR